MKNLFKAAFCFAIKDDVRIVKEEHITQAAKAVFYHKSTKITENLPMDFSFFEDSIENGKGIEFCKIENIFEEFDSIKDLPKLSKEVKAFQNKMKKLNFNLETQNVVFVSEKDYKNFSIKDFKKKLEEKTKTDILKEAKEVKEFLLEIALIKSVFIWGPPGIGKSSIVEQFAKELDLECVALLGSQLAAEDLIGIPQIKGDVSKFIPPSLIVRNKPFCLFIDELNIGSPEIQKAFYSLILNQRIGEYVLPKGSIVIGAGNRSADSALVNQLPSALINCAISVLACSKTF